MNQPLEHYHGFVFEAPQPSANTSWEDSASLVDWRPQQFWWPAQKYSVSAQPSGAGIFRTDDEFPHLDTAGIEFDSFPNLQMVVPLLNAKTLRFTGEIESHAFNYTVQKGINRLVQIDENDSVTDTSTGTAVTTRQPSGAFTFRFFKDATSATNPPLLDSFSLGITIDSQARITQANETFENNSILAVDIGGQATKNLAISAAETADVGDSMNFADTPTLSEDCTFLGRQIYFTNPDGISFSLAITTEEFFDNDDW